MDHINWKVSNTSNNNRKKIPPIKLSVSTHKIKD